MLNPEATAIGAYREARANGLSKRAAAWLAHEESGLSFSRCQRAEKPTAVFLSHESKLDYLESIR